MNQVALSEIDRLGPTTDIPTAARLIGCGRTLAYDLARRGQFPCRILRLGRRYRVPTVDLRALLGLPTTDNSQPEPTADPSLHMRQRPRS